ncbi:fungal-specific transcription factor domain-containing protein [Aspergillus cavernicola]|uniref:Fungal-specific transcription factor domain-containing protein n=1 Tax=Aspergillus cavernicola TaxID=176166 RepID=A0ABR4IQB7_9EURO
MSPEMSETGQDTSDLPEADSAAKSDGANHDRDVEDSSSAIGQTKCSICQSTFRRPEHLKRHFRSHTKEKPFECAQCGRHFSRTDTLHRHELSHHTIGTEGGKDRTHRITVKTFRACFKCALARVRCSGGMPCTRCENRSLECQYPTERRSKAKVQKGAPQALSFDQEDPLSGQSSHSFSTLSAQALGASQEDDGANSILQSGYQMGQFQLQITGSRNPSTSSPDGVAGAATQGHVHMPPEGGGDSHFVTSPSLVRSEATGVSEAMAPPFPSFAGGNQQFYAQIHQSQVQNTVPVDQGPPSYPLEGQQTEILGPGNLISGISSSDNQHVQLGFSQPLLNQPAMPTLNWLSSDLFVEPAPDQGLTSAPPTHPFQAGVYDGSLLNQTTWLPPVINMEPHGSSLSGSTSQTPSGTASLVGDLDSPGHFARGLRQLPPSRSGPSKRSTDFGVDELDGRRLKHRRKQSSWPTQTAESLDIFLKIQNSNSKPRLAFPPPQEVQAKPLSDTPVDCNLEASTYDQIFGAFSRLCCAENFLYPKFETDSFPDMQALSNFLTHYFYFYHPLYPIFHTPTFNPNRCHWIITLALAAIGSHSANFCEQNGTVTAFHEFLRRVLWVETEKSQSERPPLWLLQAILLNCVGRLHGSSERGRLSALGNFGDLAHLATREKLLSRSDKSTLSSDDASSSSEQQWILWIEEEARRRTGYLIWLVDCSAAYQFDTKPHFTLDDGQASLPCNEKIWSAGSSRIWKGLREETSEQEKVSLYDAVLTLYIEKKLVPEIGEFSHVLLIHALYHRMWEVGDYFRRPLSFWNPTAKKQSRKLAIPSGSVWLPGIPSYSKWRNSACDCLDILHWTANGTIAKANGREHPTILHLHTARIIILAPFREIRLLVNLLATQKVNWEDRQQVIEWHYVLRWIKHDQYKARLAVIHAGSVLYHVRKYSTNAFHEPVATYLAILTLWAYGLCYKQASPDLTSNISSTRGSVGPNVINLDQPCSDELVQSFVREGQAMKGMLINVGDICASHGPEQVLRAGCETLGSLHSWGIAKEFMVTLMRLVELVS